MNDRIREQLRALRIDPDATAHLEPGPRLWEGKPRRGRRVTRHTLLLAIGISAIMCVLLGGCAIVLARLHTSSVETPGASARVISHMQFGGLEADIGQPEYRSIATDGTTPSIQWITLPMAVSNPSAATLALQAGDLDLVDGRGALFAPWWREPGGAMRDGFSAPEHTLLALAPGGATDVTLVFIIREAGQYALRYSGPGAAPGHDVLLAVR